MPWACRFCGHGGCVWKLRRGNETITRPYPGLEASMRSTSLAAALALLISGCGFDGDPAAPEDREPTRPNPRLALGEPKLAAAAATTNVWTARAPLPSRRAGLGLGV